MADGFSNPFAPLIDQINNLTAQKNSAQTAAVQLNLQERIAEQTRQGLANEYLSRADFTKNPAESLRTLGSILNNPDLVKASLDVQLKQSAFNLQRKQIEDELSRQQAEQGAKTAVGESLAAGDQAGVLRNAPLAGVLGTGAVGNIAGQQFMSPEEKKLQQLKIGESQAEIGLKNAIRRKTDVEAERLSKLPINSYDKPLTRDESITQTRGLRRETKNTQAVKDFTTIRPKVAQANAAIADIKDKLTRGVKQEASIVTFQKVLDPISVVRESEFARTVEGQGLLQRIDSAIQRAIKGGYVTDETLSALNSAINDFASIAQSYANEEVDTTRDIADKFGLDKDLVAKRFTDFPETDVKQLTNPQQSQQQAAPPATGPGRFNNYIKSNKL